MKIGEYDIMVTSSVDEDELAAEIWKRKSESRTYELGSVHIENGTPIIHLGPDTESENGVWTLDYKTFKQIVKALDEFLVSIGYPPELEEEE